MSTIIPVSAPVRATKLLNIGRAWVNNNAVGNQPPISGQIDRNLGATVSLSPNDRIMFFPNAKREGVRDADFRIAIELPIAEADAIIESQMSHRASVKTSSNAEEMALASLEQPH